MIIFKHDISSIIFVKSSDLHDWRLDSPAMPNDCFSPSVLMLSAQKKWKTIDQRLIKLGVNMSYGKPYKYLWHLTLTLEFESCFRILDITWKLLARCWCSFTRYKPNCVLVGSVIHFENESTIFQRWQHADFSTSRISEHCNNFFINTIVCDHGVWL